MAGDRDSSIQRVGKRSEQTATPHPPPGPAARRPIPPKFYHIGEIVDYSGVSRQTIHNYTIMGLITEARRSGGGHRLYDESVFHRLELIAEMKRRRKSLREIRGRFARLGMSA